MPRNLKRETAYLRQTLNRAHYTASEAHVKVDSKETRLALLESDKNTKDTKIADLEADKASKDTAITDLTSRISALENGGGSSGGGSLTSETVSWTNLTEINLSGEKLLNGDFSNSSYVHDTSFCLLQSCGLQPNNGSVNDHTFAAADRPKIIALQTTSSAPVITKNNIYRIRAVNTVSEGIYIETLDGTGLGWVTPNLRGTVWEVVNLRFDDWTVVNGSIDETELANGVAAGDGGALVMQQMFSQSIPIGTKLVIKSQRTDSDSGKVYFWTLNHNGHVYGQAINMPATLEYTVVNQNLAGIRITTSSVNRKITSVSLFQGEISGGTTQVYAGGGLEKISGTSGWNAGASSTQKIDGNSDGYVQFQWAADKSVRVGLVYLDDDYGIPSPSLSITATQLVATGNKTVAVGDWFRIRHYADDNQIKYQRKEEIFDTDGNSLGQDYVTFYTEPTLTNGSDLYVDVSLYHVGSRINDATIVK